MPIELDERTYGKRWLVLRGCARYFCSLRMKPTPRGCVGLENDSSYVKDGINDYVVNGAQHAINPAGVGTKASAHYHSASGAGRNRASVCG